MKERERPEAFGSFRNPYLTNGVSLLEQKCNLYIMQSAYVFLSDIGSVSTYLSLKLLSCKMTGFSYVSTFNEQKEKERV